MILLFDADKSTSVIEDQIDKENFVIRKVRADFEGEEVVDVIDNQEVTEKVHGMDFHVRHYVNLMFKKKLVKYKDPIFGYEDEQIVVAMNDKAKELGLHTVVIDSLSGMGEAIRLSLISDSRFSNMTMDLWGKYAVRISKITTMIRDLPINVVVTCHVDYKEDDVGQDIQFAAVKGGQKTDMLRWFDVIVYTTVKEDGSVMWQVRKSDTRPYIRSRKPIPQWEDQVEVEPDFGPIYETYNDAAKILVLGDSGTGKTTSLLTIPDARANGGKQSKPKAKNSKSKTNASKSDNESE